MELKAGYKQTEVGVIPEDWEVRSLESFAKVTSGKRLPTGYFVSDTVTPHPYIRVTDMRPGWVDVRDVKYVPVAAFSPIKNYRIFRDDLFISVAGTLGIVGRIPGELDGANLTENANRISAIECDKDYLLHVMLSPVVQGVIESEQTVGAQPKLALMRIRNFSIPLPPTDAEQSAIATALSDVDALLTAQDALITKKRAIKQGAMQELLTGKRRLPGFCGEWEVKRLGEIARIQKGQLITNKTLVSGDVPVIAGGMRPAYFHSEANRQGKTITISASGASAGYVAYHDGRIFASDCSTIGESDSYCIKFLFYSMLLQQEAIYAAQTGGAQPHVQPKDLAPLVLAIPISMAEQAEIAGVLEDMDTEIIALEAQRTKTAQLKQGMMQELLTGRIRLV